MNLDFYIMIAIQAGIGAIMSTIHNPTSQNAQLLKSSLLHLADSIYMAYGVQPPTRSE